MKAFNLAAAHPQGLAWLACCVLLLLTDSTTLCAQADTENDPFEPLCRELSVLISPPQYCLPLSFERTGRMATLLMSHLTHQQLGPRFQTLFANRDLFEIHGLEFGWAPKYAVHAFLTDLMCIDMPSILRLFLMVRQGARPAGLSQLDLDQDLLHICASFAPLVLDHFVQVLFSSIFAHSNRNLHGLYSYLSRHYPFAFEQLLASRPALAEVFDYSFGGSFADGRLGTLSTQFLVSKCQTPIGPFAMSKYGQQVASESLEFGISLPSLGRLHMMDPRLSLYCILSDRKPVFNSNFELNWPFIESFLGMQIVRNHQFDSSRVSVLLSAINILIKRYEYLISVYICRNRETISTSLEMLRIISRLFYYFESYFWPAVAIVKSIVGSDPLGHSLITTIKTTVSSGPYAKLTGIYRELLLVHASRGNLSDLVLMPDIPESIAHSFKTYFGEFSEKFQMMAPNLYGTHTRPNLQTVSVASNDKPKTPKIQTMREEQASPEECELDAKIISENDESSSFRGVNSVCAALTHDPFTFSSASDICAEDTVSSPSETVDDPNSALESINSRCKGQENKANSSVPTTPPEKFDCLMKDNRQDNLPVPGNDRPSISRKKRGDKKRSSTWKPKHDQSVAGKITKQKNSMNTSSVPPADQDASQNPCSSTNSSKNRLEILENDCVSRQIIVSNITEPSGKYQNSLDDKAASVHEQNNLFSNFFSILRECDDVNDPPKAVLMDNNTDTNADDITERVSSRILAKPHELLHFQDRKPSADNEPSVDNNSPGKCTEDDASSEPPAVTPDQHKLTNKDSKSRKKKRRKQQKNESDASAAPNKQDDKNGSIPAPDEILESHLEIGIQRFLGNVPLFTVEELKKQNQLLLRRKGERLKGADTSRALPNGPAILLLKDSAGLDTLFKIVYLFLRSQYEKGTMSAVQKYFRRITEQSGCQPVRIILQFFRDTALETWNIDPIINDVISFIGNFICFEYSFGSYFNMMRTRENEPMTADGIIPVNTLYTFYYKLTSLPGGMDAFSQLVLIPAFRSSQILEAASDYFRVKCDTITEQLFCSKLSPETFRDMLENTEIYPTLRFVREYEHDFLGRRLEFGNSFPPIAQVVHRASAGNRITTQSIYSIVEAGFTEFGRNLRQSLSYDIFEDAVSRLGYKIGRHEKSATCSEAADLACCSNTDISADHEDAGVLDAANLGYEWDDLLSESQLDSAPMISPMCQFMPTPRPGLPTIDIQVNLATIVYGLILRNNLLIIFPHLLMSAKRFSDLCNDDGEQRCLNAMQSKPREVLDSALELISILRMSIMLSVYSLDFNILNMFCWSNDAEYMQLTEAVATRSNDSVFVHLLIPLYLYFFERFPELFILSAGNLVKDGARDRKFDGDCSDLPRTTELWTLVLKFTKFRKMNEVATSSGGIATFLSVHAEGYFGNEYECDFVKLDGIISAEQRQKSISYLMGVGQYYIWSRDCSRAVNTGLVHIIPEAGTNLKCNIARDGSQIGESIAKEQAMAGDDADNIIGWFGDRLLQIEGMKHDAHSIHVILSSFLSREMVLRMPGHYFRKVIAALLQLPPDDFLDLVTRLTREYGAILLHSQFVDLFPRQYFFQITTITMIVVAEFCGGNVHLSDFYRHIADYILTIDRPEDMAIVSDLVERVFLFSSSIGLTNVRRVFPGYSPFVRGTLPLLVHEFAASRLASFDELVIGRPLWSMPATVLRHMEGILETEHPACSLTKLMAIACSWLRAKLDEKMVAERAMSQTDLSASGDGPEAHRKRYNAVGDVPLRKPEPPIFRLRTESQDGIYQSGEMEGPMPSIVRPEHRSLFKFMQKSAGDKLNKEWVLSKLFQFREQIRSAPIVEAKQSRLNSDLSRIVNSARAGVSEKIIEIKRLEPAVGEILVSLIQDIVGTAPRSDGQDACDNGDTRCRNLMLLFFVEDVSYGSCVKMKNLLFSVAEIQRVLAILLSAESLPIKEEEKESLAVLFRTLIAQNPLVHMLTELMSLLTMCCPLCLLMTE